MADIWLTPRLEAFCLLARRGAVFLSELDHPEEFHRLCTHWLAAFNGEAFSLTGKGLEYARNLGFGLEDRRPLNHDHIRPANWKCPECGKVTQTYQAPDETEDTVINRMRHYHRLKHPKCKQGEMA